jgi:hypothetical protein
MLNKKGLILAVCLKNVAIVKNLFVKKNIVNASMQVFHALTHVNVLNAIIGNTYKMIKKKDKDIIRNNKFNIHKVFYKKVYKICNMCDLKSFNLLFIKIVLTY